MGGGHGMGGGRRITRRGWCVKAQNWLDIVLRWVKLARMATLASSYTLERNDVWQCWAPMVSRPVPYIQDPM